MEMFESDDFDQVLSHLDFPEIPSKTEDISNIKDPNVISSKENVLTSEPVESKSNLNFKSQCHLEFQSPDNTRFIKNDNKTSPKPLNNSSVISDNNFVSPRHTKRKVIDSHFDHKSKRKFPGPAGLLTGSLEENKDESICQMELLSQDLEFSQNGLRRHLFESPLWLRLQDDIKTWDICSTDPIKNIKQQAQAGHLRKRKAQTVIAFVDSVDRSVIDPLVILSDSSGQIKCTLHRDAWSTFSPYIVSEYCALVLLKPTVLTTGGAFKKHYLNITLSNIYAIYSSAVLNEEERDFPEGYEMISQEDFTVIKMLSSPQNLGSNPTGENEQTNEENNLLDDLDTIFSDDLF